MPPVLVFKSLLSSGGLRVKLRIPPQLLSELPALVSRQDHRRVVSLQGGHLTHALFGVLGGLIKIQHGEAVVLRMAGDRGDIFLRHPSMLELGRKGVAEGVETDPTSEAQLLELGAELDYNTLAVSGRCLPRRFTKARGQVGEQTGMTASLDVLNEVEESGVQHRLVDGDAPKR